jgi:hypothetical protein
MPHASFTFFMLGGLLFLGFVKQVVDQASTASRVEAKLVLFPDLLDGVGDAIVCDVWSGLQ